VNDSNRPLFFVHIQKTAGGTLRQSIRANLGPGELYPDSNQYDQAPLDAYWAIPRLLSLSPERREQIRAYVGHFPYIVVELLDLDLTTMTLLRDPVERTISYLKMRYSDPDRQGLTLDEIYDNPFDYPCFIHNHQTKIFSMAPDDNLDTFMDVIDVDRERLELAKENLRKIDILGLQEHYPDMLTAVSRRFGWPTVEVENTHVSGSGFSIPDNLRDRIAEENAIDIEFYEFAKALYEERTRAEASA